MSRDKGRSKAAAQSTSCSFLARASTKNSFRQGKAKLPPPAPTNGVRTSKPRQTRLEEVTDSQPMDLRT